jgi:serine/threonine-protein kinase RsbW
LWLLLRRAREFVALMKGTIELTIESRYEFLELVGAATKHVTEMVGFDEDSASWIELSVRESVINAIKHGNQLVADTPVDIRFTLDAEKLTVYVRDRGSGFDPTQLPDPLDPENLLNPNGRGIFYMRTFMDEVDYSSHPQGGTVVRMIKRCTDPLDKGEMTSDGPPEHQ